MVHQSLITDITGLPEGKFVVITQEPDRTVFLACLMHGGRGYLLESTASNHLLMTIFLLPDVLLIDPALSGLLASCLGNATPEPMKHVRLTPRQREVCDLVNKGFKNKEIAERLCISENTVRTHRENTPRKVNENNRHPPKKE